MAVIDYDKVGKAVPYPGATSTSGRWVAPATGSIVGFATTLNRVYVDDFYLDKVAQLDQLACQVTTAGLAGALIRMGIYTDFDGIPDKLVAEAVGTADATIVGVKTLNISTGILVPGRYWLAAVSQGAVCSVFGNTKNPVQHWSASAAGALQFPDVGFVQDGIAGALPAAFVSGGSVDSAIRVTARIL